jgi:DNA-nicking Smr family endonuclease
MAQRKTNAVRGSMSQLDALVRKSGIHLAVGSGSQNSKSPCIKEPASRLKEIPRERSEPETFFEAMSDVERLYWNRKSHSSSLPAFKPDEDPELEHRRMMREAFENAIPVPTLEHPEYIEGWIGIAGKRYLPNLRSGLYSIQGQIDLHGLNQTEAQAAVERYIIRMSRFRPCCIKIIHGRGINSPVGRPTLKESLPRLLSTRRLSRFVVAYASAAPGDGGVGSLYVLLRPRAR